MAEQVWRTEDGMIFLTERSALEHEARVELKTKIVNHINRLYEIFPHLDHEMVSDYICNHATVLREMLTVYLQTVNRR